jgi:hypothetical protein
LCDCDERKQFKFANADASDPLVDPAVSSVNSFIDHIGGRSVVSRLFVLAARETIGQSGITCWAVRIDHNPQWALAFGVTQYAPAEVNQRLHRSGCNIDDKTYSVSTCSIGRFIHQGQFHTPSRDNIARSPGLTRGHYYRTGTVYFRADLVANVLTIVVAPAARDATAAPEEDDDDATDRPAAVGKGGRAREWCRLQIHIPDLASYYPHCALMAPSVRISFPDPELRAPDEQ